MITVYEMKTCPDCIALDKQLSDTARFRRVDIGEHVANMKEFIRLRDTNPAFDEAKREGYIGIPCFVNEDGAICFDISEVNH